MTMYVGVQVWSEQAVREAAMNWRAAHETLVIMKDKSGARLADGYASALEMILRPEPTRENARPEEGR